MNSESVLELSEQESVEMFAVMGSGVDRPGFCHVTQLDLWGFDRHNGTAWRLKSGLMSRVFALNVMSSR